jgi:thioredoxin 1
VKSSEKKYNFNTGEGISVVNFYVSWSFYSKIQKLILNKFQQVVGSKVKIYYVNADKDKSLIEKYSITSYPSILIFKDGENVSHLKGLQDNDSLVCAVKEFLKQDEFSFN